MIFPDKLVSFKDSVIAKSVNILNTLTKQSLTILDLFNETSEYFEDVSEFLLALDTLYILGKIHLNDGSKVIDYVKKNNL